jgi:hypothetical protein|tara:strand:+ start:409 stop:663 length:255 start_codon:yes stop_codon:yes gene_type:complete
MDIIKNYKAMKTASKIAIATDDNSGIKVTKKQFNSDTGEALDDKVEYVNLEFVDTRITQCTAEIDAWTKEKTDLEQFKTDAEAL